MFTCSPLSKTIEKQIKMIEEQGGEQVEDLKLLKSNTQKLTIKNVIPENTLSEEAKNRLKSKK